MRQREIYLGELDQAQSLRLQAERDFEAKQKRLASRAEKAAKRRKRKSRKAVRVRRAECRS